MKTLKSVSMPSTGFYLFLPFGALCCKGAHDVSMPSTGFYLFLQTLQRLPIFSYYVSMPSTGFYLFLQTLQRLPIFSYYVSMPSTGFYLFLLVDSIHCYPSCSMCQCPQRASTYFFSTLPEPLILLSSGEVFCK